MSETPTYDRRKTAATIGLNRKWSQITDRLKKSESKAYDNLLKELVPYLKSVGYELDLQRSYIGRKDKGSDGWWMDGMLYVTSRDDTMVKEIEFGPVEGAKRVKDWIKDAIGFAPSSVKHVGGNTWVADIGSY